MRVLGVDIKRSPAVESLSVVPAARDFTAIHSTTNMTMAHGPWWDSDPIHESFPGAWQRNITADKSEKSLLQFSAVYRCVTGIAADIAKLRIKLVAQDEKHPRIWNEITENSPWLHVLREPNTYQIRIKFIEQWMISKLLSGNTYVLKERDARNVVSALHVLHPLLVTPLVTETGRVFYELKRDDLSGVEDEVLIIPASEIIHDTCAGLFHTLMGVSPLYACAMAATMGIRLQRQTVKFSENAGRPSGHLSASGQISDEIADKLKKQFQYEFSRGGIGGVLVTQNDMKYTPFSMIQARDAQLLELLDWTVEDVARAFSYPLFKLTKDYPPIQVVQALSVLYYSECLQIHLEKIEDLLSHGLELPLHQRVEFDLDGLMRMDTQGQYESLDKAKNTMTPNEARLVLNLAPVPGGDSVYRQHQDYSLEALAKRDAKDDPFGGAASDKAPDSGKTAEPDPESNSQEPARSAEPAFEEWHSQFEAELQRELSIP